MLISPHMFLLKLNATLVYFSAQMSFRIRSSKFRHVFGNSTRKDHCYEGIKISKHGHDSNQSAVNPLFLAVCTESAGGGSFVVLPLERVSIHMSKTLWTA